jgi:2-hydroxychromene-2-carboxylate isomerase
MSRKEVLLYIDYKSPYAFVVKDPAYELEEQFDIRLKWLPYTIDIPSYLDSVEERTEHHWRRVRYMYMDARRIAKKAGLTLYGTKKVYDSSIANIGLLYADRAGVFRPYNDTVFERFWKHELEIEDRHAIRSVLDEAGADTEGFFEFLDGEGRREHDRIRREAHELGVFGIPTFVLDGELFWGGDRIALLKERLREI